MARDDPLITMMKIAPKGDLTVDLQTYEDMIPQPPAHQPQRRLLSTTKFLVEKSVLVECQTASAKHTNIFRAMLTGHFKEAHRTEISLEDDSPPALTVFFRVLHHIDVKETFSMKHTDMWSLVQICDKYNVSTEPFEAWFEKWYMAQGDTMNVMNKREMLYPCWKFNYALGFMNATKDCVMNLGGHITERNPTKHYELHLPQRIIRKRFVVRMLLEC